MTTTAIIGLGNMGRGLAARLAGQTNVVLGALNPAESAGFARSLGLPVTAAAEAAANADIVILALGYDDALAFASKHLLTGKIVVDISNPVLADYSGLKVTGSTSAAEEIQKVIPGARVVKAFNTIFAGLFALPRVATANVPVFVAGNDQAAVEEVSTLVDRAGFKVERVGNLDAARLVEGVGMLNIRLGYGLGRGTAIAPAWLNIAA